MIIHPGKLLWHIQVALIKSTVKGYVKMTPAQERPNILKFLLWSHLVMQSETFESQSKITLRQPTLHTPTPQDSGVFTVLPGCPIPR